METYLHSTPGRLRVKHPKLRGPSSSTELLETSLDALTGVASASVNTRTGSLLVHYDTRILHPEDLKRVLSESGIFLPDGNSEHQGHRRDTSPGGAGLSVGRALFGWAVGRALEGTGFGFLAAFI